MATFKATCQKFLLICGFFVAAGAIAQTFRGTNAPGGASNFSFRIPATATNFTLSVPGSAAAYSYLFLKRGVAASETNFDFTSQFVGAGNSINLELPQAAPTNWNVAVSTPISSQIHNFTLTLQQNVKDLRTVLPVSKPLAFVNSGTVASGKWNYYRIEVGTNPVALKISLSAGNRSPDIYVQKGRVPTTSSYVKRSINITNDVLFFADAELTAGAYFIGVYSPSGAAGYTLRSEILKFSVLNFDPGLTHEGTEFFLNKNSSPTNYYFKIRTGSPDVGGWRTALTVLKGEANLYLSRGTMPSTTTATYKSERVGSDGFVLGPTQFTGGEDWYLLVVAKTNSDIRLVSGAAYVLDLGELAADNSTSTNVMIGAEGWRFFRIVTSSNSLAWRLAVNSATSRIYLKKTSVPLDLPAASELNKLSQLLVVPPYLVPGQLYFVGIPGTPQQPVNLDCREQFIADIDFRSTNTVTVTNYNYATFRVQVPLNEIAWQMDLNPLTNSTSFLYVRKNFVPNENYNDAFSEAIGYRTNTITLVPPALSDGTFYITISNLLSARSVVLSTNGSTVTTNIYPPTNTFRLTIKPPVITDIPFVGVITNDDAKRVGWRYYRVNVSDTNQLGTLGWELLLKTNFSPGTRIALRRGAVPSLWGYRNPNGGSVKYIDYLSLGSSLQRPGHQADVWYIGVYNPTNILRNFVLETREIPAQTLIADGGKLPVNNLEPLKWAYFRVDISPDVAGWDLRLTNVVGGSPRIVVTRELLPYNQIIGGVVTTNIASTFSSTMTNWPSGGQWVAHWDWTHRFLSPTGKDQTGQVLAMGMGRPMEPAVYYVGVFNIGTNACSFNVMSRLIGYGKSIPLTDLAYNGGSATNTLPPREAAYYHVNIPPNSRSWKLRVKVTSPTGEAMLLVSTNKVPNVESEKRMQKTGQTRDEQFVLLPDESRQFLRAGDYYFVVIGEGGGAAGSKIGTNLTSYVAQSLGPLAEPHLGLLDQTNLFPASETIEGGEVRCYHFDTASGLPGFEIYLKGVTNNPVFVEHGDADLFPDPGLGRGSIPSDPYGNQGGEYRPIESFGVGSANVFVQSSGYSLPGIYSETIMVKARAVNGNYPRASYRLLLKPLWPSPLTFNGGITNATASSNFWRWFKIEVPPNALGWDLRLTNVAGSPKLIVEDHVIPVFTTTSLGFNPAIHSDVIFGRWAASRDWTERAYSSNGLTNEDNRIIAFGMGRPYIVSGTYDMGFGTPVRAGTYYAGVYSSGPTRYTLVSRGIGPGFSIPVYDLAFNGGTFSTNLPPREAAYFHVVVPTNAPGWKLRMVPGSAGEATMAVGVGYLPNVLSSSAGSVWKPNSPFRKLQKPGAEEFLYLPHDGALSLDPGNYYIAVVGEGNNVTNSSRIGTNTVNITLTSSALNIIDLNTITPAAPIIRSNQTLFAGETAAYQFTVGNDVEGMEVHLDDRKGNPVMVLRAGDILPDPAAGGTGVPGDPYGTEGGYLNNFLVHPSFLTVANPTNGGTFQLLIKARSTNSVFTNASYTLRIVATGPTNLLFDGGKISIANQTNGTWRYFKVVVPTNAPGLVGWDLRLTNVLSGLPRIVVRRDILPSGLNNNFTLGGSFTWASSNQWAPNQDWTRRTFSADGLTDETGRIVAMGMNRPLVPGTYYVGVSSNPSGTNNLNYTIFSRGIGQGFSIPVVDLPFVGSATNLSLPPREAAYYRVVIPSNTPSWNVKVAGSSGEIMLLGLTNTVPNVDFCSPSFSIGFGKSIQKPGNEHFVLLPPNGQTNIASGTNYLAVIGEGTATTNTTRIGIGSSRYVISSLGSLPVVNLGLLTNDLLQADSLEGGEVKAYQFSVPPSAAAVQVELENRSGNPYMVLRTNLLLGDPGGGEAYGNEGGSQATYFHTSILTAVVPASTNTNNLTYSLTVKARALNGVFSDASYVVHVKQLTAADLNFAASQSTNGLTNVVSGLLADNQRTFYRVVIPDSLDGNRILGWKLELTQSSGVASVRVRKDALPSDVPLTGTPFVSPAAYIVPLYLTNGTWYVEVKGQNTTEFTLTSSPLTLERPAWSMPEPGDTNVTVGLTWPTFGDTGLDTNGVPIANVNLEQGYQNYYALIVPTNNIGLTRMQLDAISGNPDLYLRTNYAPTVTHNSSGGAGFVYDRSITALNTQYANWVPLDVRFATNLAPGLWYVTIRASGTANARYRLRLTVGNVEDYTLGTQVESTVAAGDWRYYRFQMPAGTAGWSINFNQVLGDVLLYIRDTIPPGNGNTTTDYRSWQTEGKGSSTFDKPGTYSITNAPTPGVNYYLGFRGGTSDATYSFTVTTSSSFAPGAKSPGIYGLTPMTTTQPPRLATPLLDASGKFQFTLQGAPGQAYIIQTSTNLIDWTYLETLTNSAEGAVLIVDPAAVESGQRFYRIQAK